ncbi:MAG: D-glycero-beta-D-manno-heptose 1,7-bisphosphate 7-phosphatase [Pseudohongiellaceae bacterium]
MMKSRSIILDRDGVINQDSDDYIKSPEQWLPIPGSIDAISKLSRAGFRIFVATNQSGLGRAYFDEFALARMHEKMHRLVEDLGGHITGVFFCPHTPEDKCACRKPATGLLDQMEHEFSLDLSGAHYVGDTEKDIDCALAKKCLPILVLTGKGASTLESLTDEKLKKIQVFPDLAAAAEHILKPGKEQTGNV